MPQNDAPLAEPGNPQETRVDKAASAANDAAAPQEKSFGRLTLGKGKPDKPRRIRGSEREFLPAALEIMETPADPAGRAIALTIAAMFVIAVTWATIGKIDIVAVTQGRIVPIGGTKQIQPREIGTVRAIHVSDGQRVEAVDVLVELDPTESEVDIGQLERERAEARIEAARLEAFIRAVQGAEPTFSPDGADVDPAIVAMHDSRLQSDLAAFAAERSAMRAELSRRSADQAAIRAEVAKLKEMIPLLAEREDTLRKLLKNGHTPKPVWQEAKTMLIERQHDLDIQKHRLEEARSSQQATERELDRMVAETLQGAYADLAEARKTLAQSDLALRKALNREGRQSLRAPVTGTVQQVAVTTIGGVVQPAEPLLVIVPEDARLEVRAQVLNKDKGAVFEGQPAEIKLEAFNFTKYGTIDGRVVSVSNDAIEDEQAGLVYDARIAMESTTIRVDGKDVALTPGMSVTAEVKTGKRRIIEFLLSPLQRYQDEAIRER